MELEKLKINKTGSARVAFQCFNAVPGDGQIAITFDESFASIAPTQVRMSWLRRWRRRCYHDSDQRWLLLLLLPRRRRVTR